MSNESVDLGVALIRHAAAGHRASRGLVEELFPFIFQASRRMSSRAISEWLEKEHKVKLSFVTIAKALREAGQHWKIFAEEIEGASWILEDSSSATAARLLYDQPYFLEMFLDSPGMQEPKNRTSPGGSLSDMDEAIELLNNRWFSLDALTRRECAPFIEEARLRNGRECRH